MKTVRIALSLLGAGLAFSLPMLGETVSPLLARGYAVLPIPQKVTLGARDIEFGPEWRLDTGPGLASDIAVRDFERLLFERQNLKLSSTPGGGHSIHLEVKPGAVVVAQGNERDRGAVAEQAYRLSITPTNIRIIGNSRTGLFYGIQTFIQLLKAQPGTLRLPEGTVEDWPELPLRIIYWDDAHHLEYLTELKAAIRQAAFYKINGFSIKLEGHFQYAHAPAVVDPYALTPAELQDLTAYALERHIELIPYLDGPAHDAFILKHPEYAALREYPESNYEFCVTNPETYHVLEGMFDDLLAATKGSRYFVLSTDEPYYVGLANNPQCQEAARAHRLGSVGKLLAEFTTKTADYLHARGRTVIFWGEYPMKPDDISALPNHLINGEVYGPQFDPVFRAHGIRQMVYTSTEGEEQLFPRYYPVPAPLLVHPARTEAGPGRVQEMLDGISLQSTENLSSTRPDAARAGEPDLMGAFVAGWADAGLHPETFWLGYATGSAAAWNRRSAHAAELQSNFYSLFYGPDATDMGRLYQLMSQGAQIWEDTWENGPSTARKPIWGDSYEVFHPPQPAHDQYLPPLPVPAPELLQTGHNWKAENELRIRVAAVELAANDELLDQLLTNLREVGFNRYNLAVYLSIASLYRQNLLMIAALGEISDLLGKAQEAAAKVKPDAALESLDRALDKAAAIRSARNAVLKETTEVWYQSWHPRVPEASGRKYLPELDDVKDHQPMRTIDMSYLVYRELLFPLGEWAAATLKSRNGYAERHHLPARAFDLQWNSTSVTANPEQER